MAKYSGGEKTDSFLFFAAGVFCFVFFNLSQKYVQEDIEKKNTDGNHENSTRLPPSLACLACARSARRRRRFES